MQSQEKMNFIQYACIIIDFLACLVIANKCLLLNINLIRYENNLVTFFFKYQRTLNAAITVGNVLCLD